MFKPNRPDDQGGFYAKVGTLLTTNVKALRTNLMRPNDPLRPAEKSFMAFQAIPIPKHQMKVTISSEFKNKGALNGITGIKIYT